MGKPYEKELDRLADTYRWALAQPIHELVNPVQALAHLSLVTTGSGGSFTTADFVASLHQRHTGKLAFPLTAMEVASTEVDLRSSAVMLFTAGGKNPDVLGAFEKTVIREPRRFLVLCTSRRTPLSARAGKFRFVDFVELGLPTGKDGFLATNSLLTAVVMFLRTYAEVMGTQATLPASLQELLGESSPGGLDEQFRPLWERNTLVVLHGPSTRSAAIDLESKFTEAALGNVRVADFRNFAHGRHHWLAKHAESTGVLAFTTPEDEATGKATVQLIPKSIPVLRLNIPHRGAVASLAALVQVLFIVGSAGRDRGSDPGRPSVPKFGRQIYHLTAKEYSKAPRGELSQEHAVAIARKTGTSFPCSRAPEGISFWRSALAGVTRRLQEARFRGLVLDYDGTLCDHDSRFVGLKPDMAKELIRLLRHDTLIGVATGRGKSVREDLQKHLPEKYWQQVLVGYYNGGDIGLLADNDRPDGAKETGPALSSVEAALRAHELLPKLVRFEFRLPQIQVEPRWPVVAHTVWHILQEVVQNVSVRGVSVLCSSHAIDVLAPGVTKRAVVDRLQAMLDDDNPAPTILCIGDQGQWPGNDFSLLSGPYSLSVDEVSQDPVTCWNLASPGFRGTQATLQYLHSLRPSREGLHLVLKRFLARRT